MKVVVDGAVVEEPVDTELDDPTVPREAFSLIQLSKAVSRISGRVEIDT